MAGTGVYLIQGRQSFTNGTRLWINNNPVLGRQLCWSNTGKRKMSSTDAFRQIFD